MPETQQLFDTFQPDEYRLTLDLTNRQARTFSGTVEVLGTYFGSTPLRLHAKDLTIHGITDSHDHVVAYTNNGEYIELDDSKSPGHRALRIEFSGTITDAMHGLYPCYFEVDGKEKELLATQFESHHAREVFPCIDEPEAKAVFDLTLITEPGVTVLGNMPTQSQAVPDATGNISTVFETSPRMSTYLLAFVVGDLHRQTTKSRRGIEVSVWATTAQPTESLGWGLEMATQLIDFYEDFYGIPYPLPKCDHVALPDFSAGAMENWGLITYREACLVVSRDGPTTLKHYVASVIAHELAHQWFGNLVTMRWWDDLWLNESFANVMQYIALDALHPEWYVWETFATDEMPLALERDAFSDVQAVSYPIHSPDEIGAAFDKAIVYAKGSRLIRMAIAYAGESEFRTGLANYFRAYQYRNATGSELWQHISAAAGKDISTFMDAWILRPGYPRVTVHRSGPQYELEQTRFSIINEASTDVWPILVSENGASAPIIFDTVSSSITNPPLILNSGGVGHYITHYDDALFRAICAQIRHGDVPVPEVLDLSYSTALLAESGHVQTTRLIDLLSSMIAIENDAIWAGVSSIVSALTRFYEQDTVQLSKFHAYLRALINPMYEQLGPTPRLTDTLTQAKTRTYVMSILALAKDARILAHGSDEINRDSSLASVHGDSRLAIMKAAVLDDKADVVAVLYELAHNTTDAGLRDDLAKALSITPNTVLAEKLVSDLSKHGRIKPQDLPRWFGYLIKNPLTRKATWDWMCKDWPRIEKMYGGDMSFDKFPQYAAQIIYGDAWLDAYQNFFGSMQHPALIRSIQIGLQAIAVRTSWVAKDRQLVVDYITRARDTIK